MGHRKALGLLLVCCPSYVCPAEHARVQRLLLLGCGAWHCGGEGILIKLE